jgi:hypothetical protein
MGAGEIIVIIMLILGGTWLVAKVVGVVWRIVRAPVMVFVDHFFVITSSMGDASAAADNRSGARSAAGDAAIVQREHMHQVN